MANTVIVFLATGCGHCTEFVPRFRRIAVRYRAHVPIHLIDLARKGALGQALANFYKVDGTPTTVVTSPDGRLVAKVSGAISNQKIVELLEQAARG